MDLKEIRNNLDTVDNKIVELYFERMELCKKVAEYKIKNNIPVLDSTREEQKIKSVRDKATDSFHKDSLEYLFKLLMERSKEMQKEIISSNKE